MTIDKAQLKALAEAADVELQANLEMTKKGIGYASFVEIPKLQQFLSPSIVLELLSEIDSLMFEPAKHSRRLIEELRAELAGLRTGYDAQNEVIAGLRAENEAIRKDAERYRWLRRGENYPHQYLVDLGMENLEGFDRSIDAAMAKEAIHDR